MGKLVQVLWRLKDKPLDRQVQDSLDNASFRFNRSPLTSEETMPAILFERDSMARWYAQQHRNTDPGVRSVYYLPTNAPNREIRLVEINELIAERNDDTLEPVDFGVDTGMDSEHRVLVLDVTPGQWERIKQSSLALPPGWSLEAAVHF